MYRTLLRQHHCEDGQMDAAWLMLGVFGGQFRPGYGLSEFRSTLLPLESEEDFIP